MFICVMLLFLIIAAAWWYITTPADTDFPELTKTENGCLYFKIDSLDVEFWIQKSMLMHKGMLTFFVEKDGMERTCEVNSDFVNQDGVQTPILAVFENTHTKFVKMTAEDRLTFSVYRLPAGMPFVGFIGLGILAILFFPWALISKKEWS